MKLIMHGAEAKAYKDQNKIIKVRIEKKYRCKELDHTLRKQRTRKEAKVLEKIASLDIAPKLLSTNNHDTLEIEYIKGKKLSESLEKLPYLRACRLLGEKIRLLHDHDVIHGDLTTSNMIYDEKQQQLFIIDFGLSFTSTKDEDKAVDLHLLKEALMSKHIAVAESAFKEVLRGYNSKAVEKRLTLVELRGRNKQKS